MLIYTEVKQQEIKYSSTSQLVVGSYNFSREYLPKVGKLKIMCSKVATHFLLFNLSWFVHQCPASYCPLADA